MAGVSNKVDMITSFSAGEFTPALAGHVDFEAYKSGSRKIENFIPEVQGGLKKFYGTREIAVLNNPENYVMVPFDGLDAPVVLVIHDGVISIIDGDNYYDTELRVTVPDVSKLDWAQQNAVIYFAHPSCMPFFIRSLGRNEEGYHTFSIEECNFVDVPYFPVGWSGNYNGVVSTNREDGTITVSAEITASCSLKVPAILSGGSGDVNVLVGGVRTPTLVARIGSTDYHATIGNTTISIIRKRNGVESVVASISNTGIQHNV